MVRPAVTEFVGVLHQGGVFPGERKMTTVFAVVIFILEEKLCSVNGADACAQCDEAAERKCDEQGGFLAIERLLLLAGAVDGFAAQDYQHTKEK